MSKKHKQTNKQTKPNNGIMSIDDERTLNMLYSTVSANRSVRFLGDIRRQYKNSAEILTNLAKEMKAHELLTDDELENAIIAFKEEIETDSTFTELMEKYYGFKKFMLRFFSCNVIIGDVKKIRGNNIEITKLSPKPLNVYLHTINTLEVEDKLEITTLICERARMDGKLTLDEAEEIVVNSMNGKYESMQAEQSAYDALEKFRGLIKSGYVFAILDENGNPQIGFETGSKGISPEFEERVSELSDHVSFETKNFGEKQN